MNHEEMTGLLHDYVRGRLQEGARLDVERALENDPAIRAELERVRAYYGDLESMPQIKAPADFLSQVRGRIERPGVLGQLRNLLFFPLHIKLPIELAATVGVSLLVIVIYNPFAPKVPMPEQFAVRGLPEVSSESHVFETVESDDRVRHADNLTEREMVTGKAGKAGPQIAPAKKTGTPVRTSGYGTGSISPQSSALASAAPSGRSGKNSDRGESGVAAHYGIAGMSKSKGASSPRLSASKPGAFADGQERSDGYVAGVMVGNNSEPSSAASGAPVAGSMASAIGAPLTPAPALAPSSHFASLADKESELESPAPSKAAEAPQESPIAYNWIPAPSPETKSLQELERPETARYELDAEKNRSLKRSEASPAREEAQVQGQIIASNSMITDNISYLKSIVATLDGTCTVVNSEGSPYRIKIPAKNFQRFEKEMRRMGDFVSVSGREINLKTIGTIDSLEILVNIIEK